MSQSAWTEEQLRAFLEEQLAPEAMSQIENDLRGSESLRNRLAALIRERAGGQHSLGEIWRRNRLSCPSREELGKSLLGVLSPEQSQYIDFHLRTIGCRICLANLQDLEEQTAAIDQTQTRRRKFFDSSAGYLSPKS